MGRSRKRSSNIDFCAAPAVQASIPKPRLIQKAAGSNAPRAVSGRQAALTSAVKSGVIAQGIMAAQAIEHRVEHAQLIKLQAGTLNKCVVERIIQRMCKQQGAQCLDEIQWTVSSFRRLQL